MNWYAKWNQHPYRNRVHMFVFLLFGFFIVGVVLRSAHVRFNSGSAKSYKASSMQDFLAVNKLKKLPKGNAAAVSYNSTDAGGVTFIEGVGSIPTGKVSSFVTSVEDDKTFVDENSEIIVVPESAQNIGKVQSKVLVRLKKEQAVPVIIRFNETAPYYSQGDSQTTRQTKAQKFQDKKSKVEQAIKGAGRLSKDLQVISGLAATLDSKDIDAVSVLPEVARIEYDEPVQASLDTSVDQINGTYAWSLVDSKGSAVTGTGMRIAIIDTGVDYTHPDLGGCFGPACKVAVGYDFVNNDANPMDDQGHGTHVAATAAGKGLLKGVAPDAKIYAYKVLGADGSGSSSNIIAAINRAVDPNADGNPSDHVEVISMSLGASGGNPDDAMSLAVDNATLAGVVSAVAAGNSGPGASTVGSPGTSRTAITVAAACKPSQIGSNSYCTNEMASFSSRGPVIWNGVDIKKPDITAPGVLICAARWAAAFASSPTCFDNAHARISGTSMATPHVAGVIALLKQANATYTPADIKSRLKSTAKTLNQPYDAQGAGLVDVKAAIPIAQKISASPSLWNPVSNVSGSTTIITQTFSVTSLTSSVSAVTLQLPTGIAGVTFKSDKTALSLSQTTPVTFTVTATVDNNTAVPGLYNPSIGFDAGGLIGFIPISLTINGNVSITNSADVNFGNDSPNLTSWTSNSQVMNIKNNRTDVSMPVSFSAAGFPAGVNVVFSPASATLTPGQSLAVNVTMNVNNSSLANGIYSGKLSAASGSQVVSVGGTFSKFFTLSIHATDNIAPDVITLYDLSNDTYIIKSFSTPDMTLYLNTPGPYHALIDYNLDNDGFTLSRSKVGKENISLSSGSFVWNVNKSDALYTVTQSFVDRNGQPANILSSITTLGFRNNQGFIYPKYHQIDYVFGNGNNNITRVNTLTNILEVKHSVKYPAWNIREIYYTDFTNTTSSKTVTNTPASFFKLIGRIPATNLTGSASHLFEYCYFGICSYNDDPEPSQVQGTAKNYEIYSLIPNTSPYQFGLTPFYLFNANPLRTGCPASGACSTVFLNHTSGNILANGNAQVENNAISIGHGPVYFSGWFSQNGSTGVILGRDRNPLFLRQDFSIGENNQIPVSIKKLSDQALVSNANIAQYLLPLTSRPYISPLYITLPAPDAYTFEFSWPYTINTANLTGSYKGTVDTRTLNDVMPRMNRFTWTVNQNNAENYVVGSANGFKFVLSQEAGTLGSATAEFSSDGVAYSPVTLTASGTTYSGTVPSVTNVTKVWVKIKASSTLGNKFEQVLQIPVGSVTPPPSSDTTPPTVTVTSPATGTTVSRNSYASIAASATDNVGVVKLEYYVNSSVVCTSTTVVPCNWKVPKSPGKTYTLTAKAYDQAGNTAISSPVSVISK